jgi:hypothetical protein
MLVLSRGVFDHCYMFFGDRFLEKDIAIIKTIGKVLLLIAVWMFSTSTLPDAGSSVLHYSVLVYYATIYQE